MPPPGPGERRGQTSSPAWGAVGHPPSSQVSPRGRETSLLGPGHPPGRPRLSLDQHSEGLAPPQPGQPPDHRTSFHRTVGPGWRGQQPGRVPPMGLRGPTMPSHWHPSVPFGVASAVAPTQGPAPGRLVTATQDQTGRVASRLCAPAPGPGRSPVATPVPWSRGRVLPDWGRGVEGVPVSPPVSGTPAQVRGDGAGGGCPVLEKVVPRGKLALGCQSVGSCADGREAAAGPGGRPGSHPARAVKGTRPVLSSVVLPGTTETVRRRVAHSPG